MPEKVGGLFKVLEHPTSRVFKALSHPIRIKMVESLQENVELSYTELLNLLNIDAGHLNFHLKIIGNLIKKTEDGNYILTDEGSVAYCLINAVKALEKEEAKVVIQQASVLKRVLATLIDFSLFIGSPVAVTFSLSIFFPLSVIDPLVVVVFLQIMLFLTFVVFTSMEAYNGQTIGKYLIKIRVVKESGRKLNLIESFARNVAKIYLLPVDLLAGLLFARKKGYIRFADYYTRARVVDISVS
ncbi:MAG: RDD family protein, partial [Candidatus Hydrothermarchaeota archaeon]|nr:RDD family protein [Candidatus Hydrothermarchaeota archaeon]